MEHRENLIRCAECKKLAPPLEMVYFWIKTLCGECANKRLLGVKKIR